MQNLSNKIQDAAKKLLEEKKVDVVIGFEQGSLPLRSTPYFARTPEETANLIWNSGCENNLANYLRKRSDKVAVVAKGCDVRSIVVLVKENQINRDNLYIIGIPCSGMIDQNKVNAAVNGKEISEAAVNGDQVVIKGEGFETTVALADMIHDFCNDCKYPTPVIFDELIGEKIVGKDNVSYAEIDEFEAKSPAERQAYLAAEMSKCIRCYACRNACPMCYCSECFVDCNTPEWISKSIDAGDNLIFHAVRALHLGGRCVDCGACTRACPMGVDIGKLTRKLAKDVKVLFDYEAGVSLEEKCALSTFTGDDSEEFLVKE
ncbi:coenzyme F420 hydrogenase/dehydrogenase beta subunit domain protein [Desulfofarcimen acetoxidans DSM 771]|uniref:Coenzyme F420 hydrogenase/dehydrogenase beta subunit domain protein n=1 Tax=Desulfofarcimen acetoxidans (strain ATCC 49208 / DSM 771 / KCTC 5769 / VKM B-1644 / 5575) TaxID=485916 RepID=C8W5H9_DESAS|nr:Coenzyme F420 hydrogenase/dehydrogenase, beta subunit C-terminal domain [Desulfofarcimen acetoxidans]ACV62161.1 coenzyme F420 hydrogenase/dehydrogenase beta subunit domain protein [Desulfofarcimen acetoxidans DSM 771]